MTGRTLHREGTTWGCILSECNIFAFCRDGQDQQEQLWVLALSCFLGD